MTAKKRRIDLWATNYNFAARVEVSVYDPLTEWEHGTISLEVIGDRIVVKRHGADVPEVVLA